MGWTIAREQQRSTSVSLWINIAMRSELLVNRYLYSHCIWDSTNRECFVAPRVQRHAVLATVLYSAVLVHTYKYEQVLVLQVVLVQVQYNPFLLCLYLYCNFHRLSGP